LAHLRLSAFWLNLAEKRRSGLEGVGGESGRSDKLLRVFMPPETGCRLESLQQSLVDLVPVSQRGQNTERKQDSV
jgi:hypothetical protein